MGEKSDVTTIEKIDKNNCVFIEMAKQMSVEEGLPKKWCVR